MIRVTKPSKAKDLSCVTLEEMAENLNVGCENGNGHFYDLGKRAFFWSSSLAIPSLFAWYRNLNCNKADVDRYFSNSYLKGNGFSVRCLRD